MKVFDVMDTSDAYTYTGLDFSNVKLDFSKTKQKKKVPAKRFVCIDLEMTEFIGEERNCIPGALGEVIQFGAVMLDSNYNLISQFNSYVKPSYSGLTASIEKLTGIEEKNLKNADDFMTVMDKFAYWRGEGDITTFCWSKIDHDQLWKELRVKGEQRNELFDILKDFVDLQKVFGNLLESKTAVSLESALRFMGMDYEGQVHTANSDAYNTARILHKVFCTKELNLDFEYINPSRKNMPAPKKEKYTNAFASFMPPELLAKFDLKPKIEENVSEKNWTVPNGKTKNIDLGLEELSGNEEIKSLCSKYRVKAKNWKMFSEMVKNTSEMMVA